MLMLEWMLLAATCMPPHMTNYSNEAWTNKDRKILAGAYDGCKRHFGIRSPCVKVFMKMDKGVHRVLCGKKTKGAKK